MSVVSVGVVGVGVVSVGVVSVGVVWLVFPGVRGGITLRTQDLPLYSCVALCLLIPQSLPIQHMQ